ncbi:cuticle protein CP14.6-like [Amphibalanus amphitrite]|uniref:cuticle protein CP14.6-like n=1 Tax=Amphibalanus amphitrite TaxID=1232801 RepID=UPI001C92B16A|nr:cuticle protein CP14.6-like [Amphibalanus amphitrite]
MTLADRWHCCSLSRIKPMCGDPLDIQSTVSHLKQSPDMNTIIVACLVAVAAAAPQISNQPDQYSGNPQPLINILSQSFEQDPNTGNYKHSYQQDNGQAVAEEGSVYPGPQPDTGSITQQGNFQFVGDDGNTYQISYVASEGGFQPRGAHLPVAPAQIPEYAQLRQEHPELFWAEGQQPQQPTYV